MFEQYYQCFLFVVVDLQEHVKLLFSDRCYSDVGVAKYFSGIIFEGWFWKLPKFWTNIQKFYPPTTNFSSAASTGQIIHKGNKSVAFFQDEIKLISLEVVLNLYHMVIAVGLLCVIPSFDLIYLSRKTNNLDWNIIAIAHKCSQ